MRKDEIPTSCNKKATTYYDVVAFRLVINRRSRNNFV